MAKYKLFLNPKCSKCRIILDLIQEIKNADIELRYYLQDPLTQDEIMSIISYLGRSSVRNLLDEEADDLESILTSDNTRLQRPLILGPDSAQICRPPELIYDFLKNEK